MNDEDKSLNLHHQNSLTSGEFQMEIHKTADYKYEEERIKSFSSWKVHYPVDPDRLAKAGFFYTGNEDEVVCFSCHGHIKGWNYGDVVLKKHAEMFPNCNFVNNKSNNVPLAQSKKSKDNLIISGKKKNGYSQPTKLSPVVNAIDYNKMKSVQERIKTFSRNWPLSCIDASQIAQAGFFYLGLGDKVQCPFCKGIVSNWEDADDPLKEHIKHFPWCDYLSGISSDFSRKKLPWFKVDSEDLCGNMKKSSISSEKYKQFQSQENQEAMDLKKLGVHLYNEPAFPQQASYGARLRSYSTWPTSAPVSKEELARAGFFYI
ncbi:baculoviral IAP repeat-containing protein 2, partial [Caerostris extrusa]